MSAKLMANRSDRHLSNLSNCQGAKPVRLIRGRCADFPSWPGVQHGAPSRGRIHDRNRISAIRAATLRTGLGPYMGPYMSVRIRPAPRASLQFLGFSHQLREKRALSRNPALQVHQRTSLVGVQTRVLEISLCLHIGRWTWLGHEIPNRSPSVAEHKHPRFVAAHESALSRAARNRLLRHLHFS